ncbi:MAG: hypothetical protein WC324_06465 [Candidatus Omnitrophota bacterium]|jgi:hypothetical protein
MLKGSIFVSCCARAFGRYLLLEELAVSFLRGSIAASMLKKSVLAGSRVLSGCFIARVAGEGKYPSFAGGSAIIRYFSHTAASFERFITRNYARSIFASFISVVAGPFNKIDWASARKDSRFLRRIYHA